jgi:hypothetical protein
MACRIRCHPVRSLFTRYPIASCYIRRCADIRCRLASHAANEACSYTSRHKGAA